MAVSTPGGDSDGVSGGAAAAAAHALLELRSALKLFQPDLCVLVLRHPAVNLASLHAKVSLSLAMPPPPSAGARGCKSTSFPITEPVTSRKLLSLSLDCFGQRAQLLPLHVCCRRFGTRAGSWRTRRLRSRPCLPNPFPPQATGCSTRWEVPSTLVGWTFSFTLESSTANNK